MVKYKLEADFLIFSERKLLLESVRSILPEQPNVVLFHSDLSNFRAENKEFIWDLLFVISVLANEGWTILFPSFTFSFCSGDPYVLTGSPSETGVLADKVLESLPFARRTADPIYSFVIVGNKLIDFKPKTTLGEGSVFEWLEQLNANIVMLGCDWKYCTQFHRYEELENVQYR